MSSLFFFNATSTTEIYTLSLHDALPIWSPIAAEALASGGYDIAWKAGADTFTIWSTDAGGNYIANIIPDTSGDRKSTRLNSSHPSISYAVFCLKKKKKKKINKIKEKNKR